MNVSTHTAGRTAARYLKSLIVAKGDPLQAEAYAAGQSWTDESRVLTALKAATEALTSADAEAMLAPIGTDFAAATRPLSVMSRLTAVRRAPMRTRLVGMSQGATASWVGEGMPKPLSHAAFTSGTTLMPRKVVATAVVSTELARATSPDAERLLLTDLIAATAQATDQAFLDPDNDGSTDDRPASITNGGPIIESSGSTPAAIDADLQSAVDQLVAHGSTLADAVWIMPPRIATALASMRGNDGAVSYPTINARGGTLLGIPVLTSASIATAASPTVHSIVLVDQDGVLVSDEDRATLSVGRHAALEMSDSPEGGATKLVSLWQNNLVALRAERFVSWAARREGAAVTIRGVAL